MCIYELIKFVYLILGGVAMILRFGLRFLANTTTTAKPMSFCSKRFRSVMGACWVFSGGQSGASRCGNAKCTANGPKNTAPNTKGPRGSAALSSVNCAYRDFCRLRKAANSPDNPIPKSATVDGSGTGFPDDAATT